MNPLCKTTATVTLLITSGLMGLPAACGETGDDEGRVADRQAEAIKALKDIRAGITRNGAGEVVAISVKCTQGLWDDPEPVPKSKWLPQFAEHLRSFPALREVSVSYWVYEDDNMRHLAGIRELTSFANDDTAFRDAVPFTGSGLRHLVMPANLQSLGLVGDGITNDSLKHVARLGHLKNLHLYGDNVSDEGLAHLATLDLHELHLHTGRITGDGLKHLSKMRNLHKLYLGANRIGDDGLEHLSDMQSLRDLNLRENKVTDAGVKHLAVLKELRRLDLSRNNLRGLRLGDLARLTKVEMLVLWGNTDLENAALEHLAKLPSVRTASVSETRVTIDALRGFRKRRPEVNLSFSAASAYQLDEKWSLTLNDDWTIQKVTFQAPADDEDMALFSEDPEMANVEYILFPYPQKVTAKGLVHLQSLKKLKTLILDECPIGDEGLEVLGRLTQLEHLKVDQGGVTGDGVAHLAALKNLKELTLTEIGLVDNDLMHLSGLTELQSLNLRGNKITLSGATQHLKNLKHLRHLYFNNKALKGDELPWRQE